MRTITYCDKCVEFLREYGTVSDIYLSLCELYIDYFEVNRPLRLICAPHGDLIIDFLERKGYLITHEIPSDTASFIVKPCGLWIRGDEFKICTCDCPANLRRHDQK